MRTVETAEDEDKNEDIWMGMGMKTNMEMEMLTTTGTGIGMGMRRRKTFSRLRVVIPLSWYAHQSPGGTRTCLLFSAQPVLCGLELASIEAPGFEVEGCPIQGS